MTGGANFTRLIYPYASSGGSHLTRVTVRLKLDRLWLALRIYGTIPVFVCSMCLHVQKCVCVCSEYIREEEKDRRHRENLGKYIFLITVSEVNAAYLGVPTAAGGGGGKERGSYLTEERQTVHGEPFKAEFTYTGVRPLCLIAICCTEEEEKKAVWGRKQRQRGEEKKKKSNS